MPPSSGDEGDRLRLDGTRIGIDRFHESPCMYQEVISAL